MAVLRLLIISLLFCLNIYTINALPWQGYTSLCSRPPETYDVVIIGAGTAGLSAAAQLLKTHHVENFTIIEARNRIGGRVFTMRDTVGKSGEFVELGAEFVHGEDRNSVYQFGKPLGLIAPDQPEKTENWFNFNGQKIPASIVEETDSAYRQLRREVEFDRDVATSVGDALKKRFETWLHSDVDTEDAPTKRALYNYFYMDESLTTGDELSKLSIDQDLNFVSASGNQQHVAENGLLSVLEHLTEDMSLRSCSRLQLNSVVKAINWDLCCCDGRKKVEVELTDGRKIQAKHVIVTLPLGVLKSNAVQFNPPLSTLKRNVINRLGYGCVNKLYLFFERSWWQTNGRVNSLFVNTIPDGITLKRSLYNTFNQSWYQQMLAFNQVYGHPTALEVWFSGTWACVLEQLPMEEVNSVADQVLKRAFSKEFDVESPIRVIKTNWCNDPYTLGGFSYISMDSKITDFEILAKPLPDSEPRMFFAGEATSSIQWSTMHGAWDTGKAAADQVASALIYRKNG